MAECIQRYKIATLQLISTMVVDLLANSKIAEYDLSSLRESGANRGLKLSPSILRTASLLDSDSLN